MAESLLTRTEAAVRLRVHVRTLDKYLASGDIVTIRIGGKVMVRVSEIDAIVAGLRPLQSKDRVDEPEGATVS